MVCMKHHYIISANQNYCGCGCFTPCSSQVAAYIHVCLNSYTVCMDFVMRCNNDHLKLQLNDWLKLTFKIVQM